VSVCSSLRQTGRSRKTPAVQQRFKAWRNKLLLEPTEQLLDNGTATLWTANSEAPSLAPKKDHNLQQLSSPQRTRYTNEPKRKDQLSQCQATVLRQERFAADAK
jgi:hypothetical protein